MPVSEKAGHYLWHRLTTEKTPPSEVIAKHNRDRGDNLTVEEVKAFMLEVSKQRNAGVSILQAIPSAANKPLLTVSKKVKKAKKG